VLRWLAHRIDGYGRTSCEFVLHAISPVDLGQATAKSLEGSPR